MSCRISRAWLKEAKFDHDIHGRQSMELTVFVPDVSPEEIEAVRDAMYTPLTAAEPGYRPEVIIERDGQVSVELLKR